MWAVWAGAPEMVLSMAQMEAGLHIYMGSNHKFVINSTDLI